jgi:hypothetical protein
MRTKSIIPSVCKNTRFLTALVFALLTVCLNAQIENVIVETYYVANENDTTDFDGGRLELGAVTYRVYVDLKPGNKLKKIYGDKNHALKFSSTEPFFNNVDGGTYAYEILRPKYRLGTVPLDTWLTIGQTVAKTAVDGKANFGILKSQDTNGSFIGGTNNNGGSSNIPEGLLTNTSAAVGIPLTTSDGMFAITLPTYTWNTFWIKSFPSKIDSTIFGSTLSKSEFVSYKAYLENEQGVSGLIPDSNQILIAQLTTKGKLSFELNLEVEQMVDTARVIFKYVANGDTLVGNEQVNSYLKYPYAPVCGCKDKSFLEYSAKFVCSDSSKCLNRVVFGCKDTMACNYDPNVNFSTPFLCCYPGKCNSRDIALVCPKVMGSTVVCDIHPNPAQSSLFLNVSTGVDQNVSYAIYNYSGTAILSDNFGSISQLINKELDISKLSNGLYLIRVNVGEQYTNIQFIKN